MPRIPVRTTPYKDVAPCTRHYKSKKDLTLKGLGKSAFINGSQYVIAFISPKGDVETHASELLQPYLHPRDPVAFPPIINHPALDILALEIKEKTRGRWANLKRLEELDLARAKDEEEGFVDVEEGDEDEEEEEEDEDTKETDFDPDSTLVGSDIDLSSLINDKPMVEARPKVNKKGLKRPSAPANSSALTSRVTTPDPDLFPVSVTLGNVEKYYESRFNTAQQSACKLIAKNWIKIIEPKKQVKFPYNGGDASKPAWWPAAVKHKEPDHLNKQERIAVLIAIFRHPSISVQQLELANATQSFQMDGNRHAILRELYLVAKEERRLLGKGAGPETMITVYLDHPAITTAEMTPDGPEKRTHSARDDQENQVPMDTKQGHFAFGDANSDRIIKRSKTASRPPPIEVMPIYTNSYEMQQWSQIASNGQLHHPHSGPMVGSWRDGLGLSVPPPHLSPYLHEGYTSTPPTEYNRLPLHPYEMHPHAHAQMDQSKYGSHLAPMMTTQSMSGTSSPVDSHSPAFGSQGQGQAGYFPRTQSASSVGVMPAQATEFYQHQYHQQHQLQMQQQHHYHLQQQQQQQQQLHQHQLQHGQPQTQGQGQGHPLQQMTQSQPEVSAPQTHQVQPQLSQSSNFNYGEPYIADFLETDFTN